VYVHPLFAPLFVLFQGTDVLSLIVKPCELCSSSAYLRACFRSCSRSSLRISTLRRSRKQIRKALRAELLRPSKLMPQGTWGDIKWWSLRKSAHPRQALRHEAGRWIRYASSITRGKVCHPVAANCAASEQLITRVYNVSITPSSPIRLCCDVGERISFCPILHCTIFISILVVPELCAT
jgi:hypothetical protein